MSMGMVGIMGIAVLLLAMFIFGTPVGFAMAIVGFFGFAYVVSFDAAVHMVGSALWTTFSSYGLTVIPLFTLMGQIVFYSGVNENCITLPTTGSVIYAADWQWLPSLPVQLFPLSAVLIQLLPRRCPLSRCRR